MAESSTGARLTLIGALAALLVLSAGTHGSTGPRPPAGVAEAAPATAPRRPATASRPRVAGVGRVLPPRPAPRPLPATGSRLAPVYSRLPIPDKVVFLGIDDGAVRDPATLAHLGERQVPFSAFLSGGPAEEDPGYWRAATAVGGTIQSHTLTHPDLTRVGAATLRREVCGPLEPYQAMFGRRPTLFRPPYGAVNDAVRRQAAECGYQAVILWKGSTNNGRLTMQDGPLRPGDIILLHWRDTLRADVDDVIARCRREGFTIGRLEDYFPPAAPVAAS